MTGREYQLIVRTPKGMPEGDAIRMLRTMVKRLWRDGHTRVLEAKAVETDNDTDSKEGRVSGRE